MSERCHTAAQLELLLEVKAESQSRQVEEAIAAEEPNDHQILSHPINVYLCIAMLNCLKVSKRWLVWFANYSPLPFEKGLIF